MNTSYLDAHKLLVWKGDVKQQKMLNKKIMVSCKWIAGYLMPGYCNVESIESIDNEINARG